MCICYQMSFKLGLVDFFVFQFITEAREFIDVALDMFLPFLSALTRRFTNNQESIDVSFLAICSDLLLGLSCVFAFSAVVDERMHIYFFYDGTANKLKRVTQ